MKTFSLLLLLCLSGCAAVINGIAPTDCYNATSGSMSIIDAAGTVLVSRPAETIHLCPPSFTKVPPAAKAGSAP